MMYIFTHFTEKATEVQRRGIAKNMSHRLFRQIPTLSSNFARSILH